MNLSDDRGSAIIEFICFGLFLQIPVLMFGLQLSSLQTSQVVVKSIARHSLRSFVLQGQSPQVTANQILRDFGISGQVQADLSCEPDCSGEGSVIRVRVSLDQAKASSVMIR